MTNEEAIKAFAQAMDFSYGRTEQINQSPVRDGWVSTGMKQVGDVEVGFTAIVWGNGNFKAFAEFVGGSQIAADAGRLLARVAE